MAKRRRAITTRWSFIPCTEDWGSIFEEADSSGARKLLQAAISPAVAESLRLSSRFAAAQPEESSTAGIEAAPVLTRKTLPVYRPDWNGTYQLYNFSVVGEALSIRLPATPHALGPDKGLRLCSVLRTLCLAYLVHANKGC